MFCVMGSLYDEMRRGERGDVGREDVLGDLR
jgi:hypothetical protein